MGLDGLLQIVGVVLVVGAIIVAVVWRTAWGRRLVLGIGAAIGLLLGSVVMIIWAFSLRPVSTVGLDVSKPSPISDYATAVAQIEALRNQELIPELDPGCQSQLLTHSRKTAKVIILVHGLTTCPRQLRELGPQFFARGYNVYMPLIPYHGWREQSAQSVMRMRAEDLAQFGDTIVDVAHGLGDEIVILGHSIGGNVATWATQHRTDVRRSLPLAPATGIPFFPLFVTVGVTNLLLWLPNINVGPDPAPPGLTQIPTHALAQTWRLHLAVANTAATTKPLSPVSIVTVNANDIAVNNALARALSEQWRTLGASADDYTFPFSLRLPHDLLEPGVPTQRIDIVYPALIDLAEGRVPDQRE